MNSVYNRELNNKIIMRIEETLIVAFVLLTICVRMIDRTNTLLLINNTILAIAGAIGWFYIVINKSQTIMLFAGISAISWTIEIIMGRAWNYDVMNFLTSIFYMGIAYFIIIDKNAIKIMKTIYLVACVVVIFQITITGQSYRLIMIEGNSYNYISVIFLLLLGMVFITNSNLKNSQIILYSVLYFAICMLSYGRGGIVSGTVLMIGVLLVNMFQRKKRSQALIIVLLIIVIIAVAVFFGSAIGRLIVEENYFGKFDSYGFDSNGRFDIWKNYINDCFGSFYAFFLGGDRFNSLSIRGGELNLHNSFLQMYASYGLMFFIANIIILVNVIKRKVHEKNWFVLAFIITFVIRSLTDKIMYEWPCEIIYYYYIFEYLCLKSRKKAANNSADLDSIRIDYRKGDI